MIFLTIFGGPVWERNVREVHQSDIAKIRNNLWKVKQRFYEKEAKISIKINCFQSGRLFRLGANRLFRLYTDSVSPFFTENKTIASFSTLVLKMSFPEYILWTKLRNIYRVFPDNITFSHKHGKVVMFSELFSLAHCSSRVPLFQVKRTQCDHSLIADWCFTIKTRV